MRLLRKLLTILIMGTYIAATILSGTTPATATAVIPLSMDMMQMGDDTGVTQKMPCEGGGLMPGCMTELGCVLLVSLPTPYSSISNLIAWSRVAYPVLTVTLDGRSVPPALDPPQSRT